MNRPIKFRVWNGKKMIFGPTDDNPSPSWVLAWAAGLNAEVMQFTGVLDKNGKEIYEGDIVKISKGRLGEQTFYVKYEDIKFTLAFMPEPFTFPMTANINWAENEFEVIGNVYETHPELFKI